MNFFAKAGNAVKNSYEELAHKVTWPTWSELTNSAVVVMIASVIIAIFIFIIDTIFDYLMTAVYSLIG